MFLLHFSFMCNTLFFCSFSSNNFFVPGIIVLSFLFFSFSFLYFYFFLLNRMQFCKFNCSSLAFSQVFFFCYKFHFFSYLLYFYTLSGIIYLQCSLERNSKINKSYWGKNRTIYCVRKVEEKEAALVQENNIHQIECNLCYVK